jgi:RES domain-containing protein
MAGRTAVAVATPPTRPLTATGWVCRGDELPAGSASDLISDKANRWNGDGEPTIYASGDPALALIETGRHPDELEARASLYTIDLRIPRAVDLRDAAVRDALDLPDAARWVRDRRRTRRISSALRRSGSCDALVVPSAGALDQPDRWNVVVFADDDEVVRRSLGSPERAGSVAVDLEKETS